MQVYLVTNKENGKQYVGQTVRTLEQRWNHHVSYALRGKGHYFAHAIKAYGPENFTVETLHVCESKAEMDFTEIFYIELLKTRSPTGYNLTAGGEGNLGWKPSQDIKERMGAPKGTRHTYEVIAKHRTLTKNQWDSGVRSKEKLAERMVGNTYTKGRKIPKEEMLKRFCFKPGNQFAKGVKQSEEQRRKRSEDQKAYWANWRLKKSESGG